MVIRQDGKLPLKSSWLKKSYAVARLVYVCVVGLFIEDTLLFCIVRHNFTLPLGCGQEARRNFKLACLLTSAIISLSMPQGSTYKKSNQGFASGKYDTEKKRAAQSRGGR